MANDTTTSSDLNERALEAEIRSLRQRLEQREQALKILNRRLLQLEHGQAGLAGLERAGGGGSADSQGLRMQVVELNEELERLRSTKLFRWASPARAVYGILRKPS